MGVYLRGGQGSVAQQFLDGTQVRPGIQNMRGEGMPDFMGEIGNGMEESFTYLSSIICTARALRRVPMRETKRGEFFGSPAMEAYVSRRTEREPHRQNPLLAPLPHHAHPRNRWSTLLTSRPTSSLNRMPQE